MSLINIIMSLFMAQARTYLFFYLLIKFLCGINESAIRLGQCYIHQGVLQH